jgi:hypothetical protein
VYDAERVVLGTEAGPVTTVLWRARAGHHSCRSSWEAPMASVVQMPARMRRGALRPSCTTRTSAPTSYPVCSPTAADPTEDNQKTAWQKSVCFFFALYAWIRQKRVRRMNARCVRSAQLSGTRRQRESDSCFLCTSASGSCRKMADLHEAAKKGDHARVQELIRSGANVNAVNQKGETALHRAVCALIVVGVFQSAANQP